MFIETGMYNFPDFDREKMPLGAISEFVCLELPKVLAKAEKSGNIKALEARIESELESKGLALFLSPVDPLARELSCLPQNPEAKKLALLDLLMIDGGLHRHGLDTPLKLKTAISELAAGLGELPTLTYDLIIRSNPHECLRTFTGLASEKIFYRTHEKMEVIIEGILSHIESGRSMGKAESFLNAARGVKLLTQEMIQFSSMPAQEFERFRSYFSARHGYRGPSGVFSANTVTLGLEVFGNDFAKRIEQVTKNIAYYPERDRPGLLHAIERASQGISLLDIGMAERAPLEERRAILNLAEAHRDFLLAHKIVVEGFLMPADKGTGGTSGIPFLAEGVEMAHGAVVKLKQGLPVKKDGGTRSAYAA